MGATRQQHVIADIMIDDRFCKTFRGYVPSKPMLMANGSCSWRVSSQDLKSAIIAKWPSLANKNFEICC